MFRYFPINHKTVLLFFFTFQFTNLSSQKVLSGQARVDSLISSLSNNLSAYQKGTIYSELIGEYGSINVDSAKLFYSKTIREINLARTTLTASEDLKKIDMLEGKTLFYTGIFYHYSLSKIDSALILYKKAIFLQEKTKDRQGISNTLNYMSRVYEGKGDSKTFYRMTIRALNIQNELKDLNGSALSLVTLGEYYKRAGLNDSSELSYNQALKILRITKNPERLAHCLREQGSF